jgi:LEA14-like dessication related protein
MKKKIFKFIASWLILVIVLWTRGLSEPLPKKDLQVNLLERKVSELTPSGLTLSFVYGIDNASNKKYFLFSYEYQVLINQKEYLRQQVSLDEPIEILPDKTTSVHFPVKINYQYLNPLLTEGQKQSVCQVSGEMYFQDEKKKIEKISFNFLMDFPLFKFPEIDFLPLEVKDLTLGGAEFFFRFNLKNRNSYDLLIQKIQVDLNLEDRSIFTGQIPGDKSLHSGQVRTFSIPLVLDFFELGRNYRECLQQETTLFILKATFEVDSAWGWLNFSIEKKERVKKDFSR